MTILNLEDDIFKHHAICRAVEGGVSGRVQIDRAGNLEDGLRMLAEHEDKGQPYDLIITDMWYPEKGGGKDTDSGDALIRKLAESGRSIPVILCSTLSYSYPEILGTVHYSEREDWETELVRLIGKVR